MENTPQGPQKTRNARACEACRACKSRCYFRTAQQNICQRCELNGYSCVVRSKARPMRARAQRTTSTATNRTISPKPDGSDFSLDLPSTIAPDGIKDIRDIHEHHQHVFGDEDSELKNGCPEEGTKIIEQRKLTSQEAEQLLSDFRNKAPFFPFVIVPSDATVQSLSRKSPFLLLAILTTAASMNPPLRHQLDHEFRKILSSKLIVEGRKSLDFLQGLLIYLAWYPIHSGPKNNQIFMYINLAVSLAVDLGLHDDAHNSLNLISVKPDGLIVNGCFTQAAKRAYLGAYYISATMTMGFAKPIHLEYRNLMDTQGESLLRDETQEEVIVLIALQRLTEKIASFYWGKKIDPQDPNHSLSAEMNVQLFQSELDRWRLNTPEQIRNLPNIALAERFNAICIYSNELGFLKRPYREHVSAIVATASQTHISACLQVCKHYFEFLLSLPESSYLNFGVVQWSHMVQSTVVLSRLTFLMASTRNWNSDTTRSNIPMAMYLDAMCYRFQALSSANPRIGTPRTPDHLYVFKMVLSSVKKSYEKRVANLKPDMHAVDKRGHCPLFDPSLQQYFDIDGNPGPTFDGSWEDMTTPDLSQTDFSGTDWSGTGETSCSNSTGSIGIDAAGPPFYFDLWATMTSSWAENLDVIHSEMI